MKRLVLVHTVPPLVAAFDRLAREILPGVQVFHVLDEPILEKVRLHNLQAVDSAEVAESFHAAIAAHLQEHVTTAQHILAEALLVTCSTVSPYVDLLSSRLPLVKIDEAMIAQAVARAGRIGVLATNPTTLTPTRMSLEQQAARTGRPVEVRVRLVEGAFAALMAGDELTHDRLLIEAIAAEVKQNDLVILAQASMAHVVDRLPAGVERGLVLTSPHTALLRVKQILEG